MRPRVGLVGTPVVCPEEIDLASRWLRARRWFFPTPRRRQWWRARMHSFGWEGMSEVPPADPHRHWDGQRWLRWDGQQWSSEPTATVVPSPSVARRAWPARHPIATLALGLIGLLVTVSAVGAALSSKPPAPSANSALSGASADATSASTSTQPSTIPASSTTPTPIRPAPVVAVPLVGSGGAYLPARVATPGATNPAVTQATIDQTICRSGYTATIRPPESYTEALKIAQLDGGYAIRGNANPAAYEEDHLIPLELGGAPRNPHNLWPEPWEHSSAHPAGFAAPGTGAQTKDQIENLFHREVCDRQLLLARAQALIAVNWRSAFNTYMAGGSSSQSARPTSGASQSPPPTTGRLACSASISNSRPAQYSTVDVLVTTSPGATVTATAHYKTTVTTHTATAGSSGRAAIPFRISRATSGFTVIVDIAVSKSGAGASCSTSFTPQ